MKCILTSVGDDCVGTLLSGLVSGTRTEGAGGLERSLTRVVAAVVTGVWGGGDGLGVEGEGGGGGGQHPQPHPLYHKRQLDFYSLRSSSVRY